MRNSLICLVAAAGLLSACSPAQNTALAMHPPASPFTALLLADGASVIGTGKTVEDHVIGWVSGKDCSLIRAAHGGDYCVDDTPPKKIAVVSYCYRTIGAATCYDRKLDNEEGSFSGTRVDMVPVARP